VGINPAEGQYRSGPSESRRKDSPHRPRPTVILTVGRSDAPEGQIQLAAASCACSDQARGPPLSLSRRPGRLMSISITTPRNKPAMKRAGLRSLGHRLLTTAVAISLSAVGVFTLMETPAQAASSGSLSFAQVEGFGGHPLILPAVQRPRKRGFPG